MPWPRLIGRLRVWWARGMPGGDLERRLLGQRGEREALRFLKRAGFRVLGRNVRDRHGEADAVCLDPDGLTIVLVEVKSRRLPADDAPHRQLPPEASVGSEKTRKLRDLARSIVRANGWQERPLRIDVVAVEWPEAGRPVIRHHAGAA